MGGHGALTVALTHPDRYRRQRLLADRRTSQVRGESRRWAAISATTRQHGANMTPLR